MRCPISPRWIVLALLAFAVSTTAAHAQDEDPPPLTEEEGWRTTLVGQLAFSQAAYSNWQEGGLNSLAFTAGTNGRFERLIGRFKQTHAGRLAYGVVKQDTLDLRKAVDVIRYHFDIQYTGTGVFRPTFATEIRTQFAPGFDFDPTPEEYPTLADQIEPNEELKVSDFFAPALWTQSLGVTYDPGQWYTFRLGFAVKETIVTIDRFRPIYGNDLDEAVRVEAGLEAIAEAQRELFENVLWTSRLGVFQAFNQIGDDAPDITFDNLLQLKVNDWLNTNLEVALIYDKDTIDEIQLKEVLSIGVAISFL